MDHLRAVQFPEAGEGVQLIFRNRDIKVLRDKYGANYLEIVEKGILIYDVEVMDLCVAVAAKDRDGKPVKVALDDLDHLPLASVSNKLMDAYSLSASGRTWKEQQEHNQQELMKLAKTLGGEGADRPPLVQVDSSELSSAPPSGQE